MLLLFELIKLFLFWFEYKLILLLLTLLLLFSSLFKLLFILKLFTLI